LKGRNNSKGALIKSGGECRKHKKGGKVGADDDDDDDDGDEDDDGDALKRKSN